MSGRWMRGVVAVVALAEGTARAALVGSLHVSPPGPLVQGQIVTVTLTISNTGSAAVSMSFPMGPGTGPSVPSVAPAGALAFGNWQGASGPQELSSPYSLAAGGAVTFKWYARADGVTTATVSYAGISPATTPAATSTTIRILGTGDLHAAGGPAKGFIEVRNNIIRLEHRTTAYILVHGEPGATCSLALYGPSGLHLRDIAADVVLGADGLATRPFTFGGGSTN